ncbi:MAG: hypothetical protein GY750_17080 [Lentisphaerae bacterium]|nr:hypothetical protein [Lentisphaerota bacterium]MCP4103111.1 hypothetical protein [Lentisphaerota bacterium]
MRTIFKTLSFFIFINCLNFNMLSQNTNTALSTASYTIRAQAKFAKDIRGESDEVEQLYQRSHLTNTLTKEDLKTFEDDINFLLASKLISKKVDISKLIEPTLLNE